MVFVLAIKKLLEREIHEATGIAVAALRGVPLSDFVMEERLKWAEMRRTTRDEDWAYCLLGICDVSMSPIYGEGRDKAIRRLRKKIADAAFQDDTPGSQAIWVVPLQPNPSFTGRIGELSALRKMLFATPTIAITGLGGVGKTHLVLKLLYRMRTEYRDCSVIWIPATSMESLEQGYLNAAKELGILQSEGKDADVRALVRDHLGGQGAGRWLVVF